LPARKEEVQAAARTRSCGWREAAPTIFVVVEDASASPPCCIRNELDSDLWFAVRLPASGRGAERDLVWDVLPAGSGDVPLLWDENRLVRQGSAAAGEKAASSLSVLLSSCEPEAAGGMSHYVQFGFGELYAVRPLRDAEHGRVAFGRVIMHESGVDTRVLRVTKQIDASEQMDASGPRAGPQSRPYPAGSGRLLLPSDMLLPPVGASPALRRLALAPGAAVPAEDAQSPLSYSVELELHGLSIAIIDAAPKELLQLNLRHINIGFVSDGAASRITCGVGSLSVDNLLNESFNPLVLWSDEPDSSGAVKPFLKLDADRRLNHAHASFKKVEAKVAPLNLVLDLALLKALSQTQWSQDGPAAGRQVVPIGSSRRLVSTFRALRHGGIAVPVEATQRGAVTGAGGELYLQHVSLSPLKLRATVAMGATFVADPKRELLEVIERLLPRVPDGLEILLPMLSNLASVTDASFSVSAFEVHDVFSSLGALAAVAATQWSSEMMRDLMVAMGSIDMFGNPVGLARRWRAAAAAVTEHGLEVVKTRDVAAFGRSAGLELLHGVIGSSADSISKLLRSVHGCLSTLQLTTAENRRLIARERPRDIQQGFEAGSRVLKLTFLDALGGVVHKPRANGARPCARNGLFFKQLGLATAQCVASPVTGLVGAGSVVLLSVDATTRKLSGKEETRRMRPPRVFDTKMPQLVSLEDRMVVKLQMVLEGFVPPPVAADAGSSAGLRKGTLMVKVRLLSQLKEGLPTVVQEHRTRAIDWPKVKHWEELLVLEPDCLEDVIQLELWNEPAVERYGSGSKLYAVTEIAVCDIRHRCKLEAPGPHSPPQQHSPAPSRSASPSPGPSPLLPLRSPPPPRSPPLRTPTRLGVGGEDEPAARRSSSGSDSRQGVSDSSPRRRQVVSASTTRAVGAFILGKSPASPATMPWTSGPAQLAPPEPTIIRTFSEVEEEARGQLDEESKWTMARRVQNAVRIWLIRLRLPVEDLAVLRVTVKRASGVPNLELLGGASDPFLRFTIAGWHTNMTRQTGVARTSASTGRELKAVDGLIDPAWDETVDCLVRLEPLLKLGLEVLDHETFGEHKLMARAESVALFENVAEMRTLVASREPLIKEFKLTPTPASFLGGGSASRRSCTVTLALEARRVPREKEELAKGHPLPLPLQRPNRLAAASGGGRQLGTLNLRFKVWDGMCDTHQDSLWRDWEGSAGAGGASPKSEAERLAHDIEVRRRTSQASEDPLRFPNLRV